MDTATKITTGTTLLLAITAIVLSAGLIGQENVYACEANQIAMQCDKLSAVNADGFQTRCYYEDEIENRTRYKTCKTGWLPYVMEQETFPNLTTEEGKLCRIFNENSLVKECKTELNETYLYIIGKG